MRLHTYTAGNIYGQESGWPRKGIMMNHLIVMLSVVCWVVFGLPVSPAQCDVASCQADNQGTIVSCMEFASGKPIPAPMEKICTKGGSQNTKWMKNSCPRSGAIGYCEIHRQDTITQVIYCYKRQGIPDKQKLESCKQACKGRFAAY
jgi:hypothetical protein